MQEQPGVGIIEVTPRIGMLIWSWSQSLLSSPVIEIDGVPHEAEWGKQQIFEVEPGTHRITIFARPHVRPLIGEASRTMRMYEGSADVSVEANGAAKVSYNYFSASTSGGMNAIGVEQGLAPSFAAARPRQPAAAPTVTGEASLQGEPGPNPSAVPASVTCTSCGAEHPREARFCQNCGTPVSASSALMTCATCGNAQSSGKFCANCGAAMEV